MIGKGNDNLAGAAEGKVFSGGWLAAPGVAKPCDSCKASPAVLFCRADSAFLCAACDGKVHGANKLASRHERVWLCEVCEQSPAIVTCKADAAALCASCDADIHSANPLAHRHQRLPVAPFFHTPTPAPAFFDDDDDDDGRGVAVAEEEGAASWLLLNQNPNQNPKISEAVEFKSGEFFFSDVDRYLDLDYDSPIEHKFGGYNSAAMDSVVPVQTDRTDYFAADAGVGDYHPKNNPSSYTYIAPSLSHSMSSSSLEVGVVPDGGDAAAAGSGVAAQLTGVEREARVLRYREKRKNRRFEKTIRYASRKAYAETRPRIKGRFAKRVAGAADVAGIFSAAGSACCLRLSAAIITTTLASMAAGSFTHDSLAVPSLFWLPAP